jgi:tetratricopeptide (TPR) repeat protein
MLSFEGEDGELSIRRFEKMLKTNDTYFFDSSDFERIIAHYLDLGKLSLAEKAVGLALNQHPSSFVLQLFKAEILIIKDETTEALAILNILENIESSNEDIYILKASIYSKQNKHQEAIAILNNVLTFTEDKFESHNLLAMEHLFVDNFSEALNHFKACLAINETDVNTLYNVTYCYDMLDKDEELIIFLKDYIDRQPYSEIAWHLLGKKYFEKENYKKALRAFDYAILIDERFIGALVEQAKTYEKLHEYEKAAANYHITLKLDDPTAFAYLRLGVCYQELKQNQDAIAYFNKAVLEDPMLVKAWVAIITFYMEHNEYEKALLYTKKALNANESSDLLWKLAAIVSFESQLYEESELAYDKCLDLGNYEKSTYLDYIDVLLILGKKEKAIQVLTKAKEYYDDALIVYLMAAFSYDLGLADVAGVYLLAALENDSTIYQEIANQFEVLQNRKARKLFKKFLSEEK